MREIVLGILTEARVPMTAYEMLGRLRDDTPKIAPPTVYRALNQLIASHDIHRLESINAYAACQHDHHQTASIFSICDACGATDEHVDETAVNVLSALSMRNGFVPNRQIIEVHGQCAECHGADGQGADGHSDNGHSDTGQGDTGPVDNQQGDAVEPST